MVKAWKRVIAVTVMAVLLSTAVDAQTKAEKLISLVELQGLQEMIDEQFAAQIAHAEQTNQHMFERLRTQLQSNKALWDKAQVLGRSFLQPAGPTGRPKRPCRSGRLCMVPR